jgi:dihydroneopterin aldolase
MTLKTDTVIGIYGWEHNIRQAIRQTMSLDSAEMVANINQAAKSDNGWIT